MPRVEVTARGISSSRARMISRSVLVERGGAMLGPGVVLVTMMEPLIRVDTSRTGTDCGWR